MPKPEPRPLRTLPERAFHARARLVAALMCCVCFSGQVYAPVCRGYD